MTVDVVISPGTMGLAWTAIDLLGVDHVDPGEWMHPVRLLNLSEADADAAIELLKELGPELQFRKTPSK